MPYLGRAPTVANNVTGDLAVSGAILADGQISGGRINHKLALDGSDAGGSNEYDQFIFEDGGTDGSGTNAGDNLLLENATGGQVISGENVTNIPLSNINTGASTSGHFLKSQGAGLAAVFDAVDSPGMTLVSHQSITSSTAAMEFTNLVEEFHVLYLYNVKPVSDSVNLRMRFSIDNGSSFMSGSQYGYAVTANDSGGTTNDSSGQNAAQIVFSGSESTSNTASGSVYRIFFDRAKLNTTECLGTWQGCVRGASSHMDSVNGAFLKHSLSGNDVDALQIYFSSGNIATMEGSLFSVAVA